MGEMKRAIAREEQERRNQDRFASTVVIAAAIIAAVRLARDDSNYPPAEPVALRLLAPQRGLFATVQSKSKNKSKSLVLLSSLP